MVIPYTTHPTLMGRFDRDGGFGSGRQGGFRKDKFGPKGETDAHGNYRTENVWRSGSTSNRGGFTKPWEKRNNDFGGDRGGFKKPWEKREGDFGGGDRGGFKKPWEKREGDFGGGRDRGFGSDRRDGGFKKPWEKRDGDFGGGRDRGFGGNRRDGGFKKPWEKRDGDFGGGRDRGFGGDRREGGFKKPWEKREGGFGGGDRGGFKKPWEKRDGGFGRDDDFGGDDHEFGGDRREGRFKKPWEKRDGGFGGGRDRGFGGDRKPWGEKREGGFGGRDRGFGGDRKPWGAKREGGFGGGFKKPWEKREGADETSIEATEAKPKKRNVPSIPEGELLFGRQPVREMLRANRRVVRSMVLSDGVKDSEEVLEIKQFCEEREINIEFHTRETLDAWLNAANHQGVMAVCEEYPYAELDEILSAVEAKEGNALLVILDHVVDPQNLGSLLRTCETAGALGVVIPANKAVGVTPAAVRASAGAAEHIKVARVSNLVSVIERLKEMNVWTTGLEAGEESKPYTAIDYMGKTCIVIGSEGQGLCSPVRGKCDNLASLPMFGQVSSLNAGVAGAIAIYEVLRQHNG